MNATMRANHSSKHRRSRRPKAHDQESATWSIPPKVRQRRGRVQSESVESANKQTDKQPDKQTQTDKQTDNANQGRIHGNPPQIGGLAEGEGEGCRQTRCRRRSRQRGPTEEVDQGVAKAEAA